MPDEKLIRFVYYYYYYIIIYMFLFLFSKTRRKTGRQLDLFPNRHVHPALNPVLWSMLLFRLAMVPTYTVSVTPTNYSRILDNTRTRFINF